MNSYLKIGELAKLTGITVRTLHFYDEVGLLKPSQITESGHRLYSSKNFTELYRIIALKDMGLSLEEIKKFLSSNDDGILKLIEIQIFRVQDEIARKQLLFSKLLKLKQGIEENKEISMDNLKEMVQFINSSADEYLTEDQLNKLKANYNIANNESTMVTEWMNFISELENCYKKNLPKTHPLTMKCITYWSKMTSMFIGSDEQMGKAIASFHSSPGSEQFKYGLTDELYQYLINVIDK